MAVLKAEAAAAMAANAELAAELGLTAPRGEEAGGAAAAREAAAVGGEGGGGARDVGVEVAGVGA